MDKTAQKRSLLNKLEEMTNVSGFSAENVPLLKQDGFREVMDNLRKVDDDIRSIAVGKSIGDSTIDTDGVSLKELLNEAKKNINRREYTIAISFLGRFRKKIRQINDLGKAFDSDVSGIHEKLLLDGLDDETQNHLRELRQSFAMQKEAGIKDFLVNILSSRGKALKHWEKTYPNQVKKLKEETKGMLNRSSSLYDILLDSLGKLGAFRAKRQVDVYATELNNLSKRVNDYEKAFKVFYDTNVKGFLDRLPQPKEEEMKQDTTEVAPLPVLSPETQKPVTIPQGPSSAIFAPMDLGPKQDVVSPNRPMPMQSEMLDVDLGPKEEEVVRPTLPSVHVEQMRQAPPSTPVEVSSPAPQAPPAAVTPPPAKPVPQAKAPGNLRSQLLKKNPPPTPAPLTPPAPPVKTPKPPEGINTWDLGLSNDAGFRSHAEFYSLLNKLAKTDPSKMASFIKKYAQSISSTDVATSIQLLKVAKSIGG